MKAADRVERNRLVGARRASGVSWTEIAAEFGISERHAKRLVSNARLLPEPVAVMAERPTEVQRLVLDAHLVAVETLRVHCGSANAAVAVGAARSLPGTALAMLACFGAFGVVPTSASGWRFLADLPALMGAIGRACDEAGVERADLLRHLRVQLDGVVDADYVVDQAKAEMS